MSLRGKWTQRYSKAAKGFGTDEGRDGVCSLTRSGQEDGTNWKGSRL